MEISLNISSDDDGYLRRECPSCFRQFKWRSDLGLPQNQMFFCPYCGVKSEGANWWTQEQLAYIRAVSTSAVQADMAKALRAQLRGSRFVKVTPATTGDAIVPTPPGDINDMTPVASPCHPEARIKVDSPASALFCLLCGAHSASSTPKVEDFNRLASESTGGGMHNTWRIQSEVLVYLAKASDGELAGVDDKQVAGRDLLSMLQSLSLSPSPQKLRSQLDFLHQRRFIDMVGLTGAGVDPLECYSKIQASGYSLAGNWESTQGRALRLLETLHRASLGEIPEVRIHQERILASEEFSHLMRRTSANHIQLLRYLEGTGLIEISWANGGIVLSVTLRASAVDRVERLTLDSLNRQAPEPQAAARQTEVKIAILTALPTEFAAMQLMLEEATPWAPRGPAQGGSYLRGRLGRQRVVVALPPDLGNNTAATFATALLHEIPSVQHIVMCGIAGGIPKPGVPEHDVRLGDIVVSDHHGVVQYDFVKESESFFEHRHRPRPPSAWLLGAVRQLRTREQLFEYPWEVHLGQGARLKNGDRPGDNLDAQGNHIDYAPDPERRPAMPRVFHAPIASANTLLKNPAHRDYLSETFGVKAVEMEGSGVADATWNLEIGYLVVRGIVDYCDEHKGDRWHGAAAIAAAAYVKALIEALPAQD